MKNNDVSIRIENRIEWRKIYNMKLIIKRKRDEIYLFSLYKQIPIILNIHKEKFKINNKFILYNKH